METEAGEHRQEDGANINEEERAEREGEGPSPPPPDSQHDALVEEQGRATAVDDVDASSASPSPSPAPRDHVERSTEVLADTGVTAETDEEEVIETTPLTLRTRAGESVDVEAPTEVKNDTLALTLVERSGVPGAYHAVSRRHGADRSASRAAAEAQGGGEGEGGAAAAAPSSSQGPQTTSAGDSREAQQTRGQDVGGGAPHETTDRSSSRAQGEDDEDGAAAAAAGASSGPRSAEASRALPSQEEQDGGIDQSATTLPSTEGTAQTQRGSSTGHDPKNIAAPNAPGGAAGKGGPAYVGNSTAVGSSGHEINHGASVNVASAGASELTVGGGDSDNSQVDSSSSGQIADIASVGVAAASNGNDDGAQMDRRAENESAAASVSTASITAHVSEDGAPVEGRLYVESSVRIREQLLRNAPLVESVVAMPDIQQHDGDDDEQEFDAPRHVPRCKSRVSALYAIVALVVCLVAAAIVTAVVVTRDNDDDDGPSPAASDSSLPYPTAIPSISSSHIPSAAPASTTSQVEESEEFNKLRDVVSAISSSESLTDPDSPQYRALSWLVHDDAANLTAYDTEEERLIQRYVAATVLLSTGNASHQFPLGDMVGDECTWNKALPESANGIPGVPGGIKCSEDGKIIAINFAPHLFRPIVGSLPPEIGYLPRLQQALFTDNPDLIGTIPSTITLLQELKRIFINRNNGIGGTIPLFTAPSLRVISMSGGSSLSGTIPSSIGNLTRLVSLILANTNINGTVPDSIAGLKELAVLGMDDNNLTGALPSSLGQNQDDLVLISFGDNMLNGTIPSGLLSRKNLRGLFLHGNHLSGTIGTEFGDIIALKKLFLNSNFLTSTIPSELGNLINLESLELGDNLLNGTVPMALGNLANLESLSLVENSDLSGDLNFLCNMSLANLLMDCDVSNPEFVCDCCECCQSSSHTCGVVSEGAVASRTFLYIECCMKKQCGKFDCVGEQI